MPAQSALSLGIAAHPVPDPALSANVYCSGRLCDVIQNLVAPFWCDRCRRTPDSAAYVWVMRYARCGEHLKIRLHCTDAEAPALRERLDAAQAEYLSRLMPLAPGPRRRITRAAPPIDVEDRATADYPDRTFLWTTYNRSFLSLGHRPYLDDDGYVSLATQCLARSTELLFWRLRCGEDGRSLYAVQRALLLDALLAGVGTLLPAAEDRSLYLLYHRDSLLRYLRRRQGWTDGAGAMSDVLSRFARRTAQQSSDMAELANAAAALWGWGRKPRPEAELDVWCGALSDLAAFVAPWQGEPAYQVDPFADRSIFTVFFKVLHGLANQVGIDPFNEVFLVHALLQVAAEPGFRDRPVRLRPEL